MITKIKKLISGEKSVDSILGQFTKAIQELDAHGVRMGEKHLVAVEEANKLRAEAASYLDESKRAYKISDKLVGLLEG